MIYKEFDAEFHGDACAVTGTAVYTFEKDECFDADHGGRDGVEISSVELLRVELDGTHLKRDQIEMIIGKSALTAIEDSTAEKLQSLADQGDLK